MQQIDHESTPPAPGVGALFLTFFSISVMGFGGVLPWARWMIVEKRGWLTPAEFNEVLSLCQFLPGGNVVNFGVVVGNRYQGPLGAIAAVSGMLIGPFFVVIGLAYMYVRFEDVPGLSGALAGVGAAAAGLMASTAAKMAIAMRGDVLPLILAAGGFVAVGLLRLPLLYVVLAMAPITVLYAWRRVR